MCPISNIIVNDTLFPLKSRFLEGKSNIIKHKTTAKNDGKEEYKSIMDFRYGHSLELKK